MGNEGRSGGPQGSKSTRSSEEPFFCSVDYDLGDLASEMNRQFDGVRVVGCTTAGEVGPAGYRDRSFVSMNCDISSSLKPRIWCMTCGIGWSKSRRRLTQPTLSPCC